VTYRLQNSAGVPFTINQVTGEVTTTQVFDVETDASDVYSITVVAESSDNSTEMRTFDITVVDVNEFAPVVQEVEITISEATPTSTEIAVLQATDNDISSTLEQWTIVSGTSNVFVVDPVSGSLQVGPSISLDAEDTEQYVLWVSVSDGVNVSGLAGVTINITDVNEYNISAVIDDNPIANTVASNATVGTQVGVTALAEDADLSDGVKYSLMGPSAGLFEIDANTGVVTTLVSLANEAGTSHDITIEAISDDGSVSTVIETVFVTGPIGPITDSDTATNTVLEGSPVGTVVGITALGIDPDASDTVTYSLQNSAGVPFTINQVTGEVTTTQVFDVETDASTTYDITVVAESSDGTEEMRTFTINVEDVNEHSVSTPVDADPAANEINEELPAGTNVGITVQAIDPDASDLVTYSLIDDANGQFAIDPVSGIVTTTTPLSAETATTWKIEAAATSNDGSSLSQEFTVAVVNVDEFAVSVPVNLESTESTVPESIAIGSPVGIIAQAMDADLSDSVLYSIDGPEQSLFSVDSVTGEVTTNAALDFENQENHQITVTAESSDGSTSSAVFTVNVQDINEHEPVIIPSVFSIEENSTQLNITSLKANDSDGSATLVDWQIESGNESNVFVLDDTTGELSFAPGVVIDHESAGQYELLVSVSDGVNRSEPTLITVTVEDVNEAPTFEGAEFETTTDFLGTIGQLEVTDPDTGDTHEFTLQSADSSELSLTPDGVLVQQDLLAQGAIEIPVEVVDAAGASASGIVLLNVVEVEPVPELMPEPGAANPTIDLTPSRPTVQIIETQSVSELLNTNANDQNEAANEPTVSVVEEESSLSSSVASANSAESTDATEDSIFESNNDSAESDTLLASENFSTADPLDQSSVNTGDLLRQNAVELRLANRVNDSLIGLASADLGSNRRLLLNVLVNADAESSAELNSLNNSFISQYVGSAFSPELINALQSVSNDLANEAKEEQKQENLRVSTTTFVGGALTVGFVTWLLQSGSLVATAMTTAPLWQSLDPIPVLVNDDSDSDSDSEF